MPRRRATGPPKPEHREPPPFDALAFKERAQEELRRATAGMTPEQERSFYRQQARTGPLGTWSAQIQAQGPTASMNVEPADDETASDRTPSSARAAQPPGSPNSQALARKRRQRGHNGTTGTSGQTRRRSAYRQLPQDRSSPSKARGPSPECRRTGPPVSPGPDRAGAGEPPGRPGAGSFRAGPPRPAPDWPAVTRPTPRRLWRAGADRDRRRGGGVIGPDSNGWA